jgi:hypothetical protein
MRHKWRQFNDLAIKTVTAGSPVATLSPNNSNTVSLFAIYFSINRPFSPDFGGRVAFWRLFAKKQITANDLSHLQPYVTFGIIWPFLLRYSCLQLRLCRFHWLDVQLGIQIYRYLKAAAQRNERPGCYFTNSVWEVRCFFMRGYKLSSQ